MYTPFTRGFTLIEVAIAMVLATLVLGAVLIPLAGQIDARRVGVAREKINEIQDALIGFAVANGRLPCPASPESNGQESFCSTGDPAETCTPTPASRTHGRCSHFMNGFLPAATLGISPSDTEGYAIDPWSGPENRWRYAVASNDVGTTKFPFTATNGMKLATANAIAKEDELLSVCGSGATGTSGCGSAVTLTSNAPAVIWSPGRNGSADGASANERENMDNDRVFVSSDIADPGSPAGEFDDIVGWMSLHILISRMLSAGQL